QYSIKNLLYQDRFSVIVRSAVGIQSANDQCILPCKQTTSAVNQLLRNVASKEWHIVKHLTLNPCDCSDPVNTLCSILKVEAYIRLRQQFRNIVIAIPNIRFPCG